MRREIAERDEFRVTEMAVDCPFEELDSLLLVVASAAAPLHVFGGPKGLSLATRSYRLLLARFRDWAWS
jgi:hypothetical protein